MNKYEKYKNSGVDWIGDIPENWELIRFKNLFKEINEKSLEGNEELLSVSQYTGVTKKSDKIEGDELITTAISLVGYKKVYKNDLVSNIMLAWNGSLGFSPYNGITSPAYSVYRLNDKNSKGYFHYLVTSELYKSEFKRNSSGVIESRLRLYSDNFYSIWSLLPPLEEQEAIAKYLDEKTTKIEQAIAQKEKMISLLKEEKQIIIQNAVTKGLNPNANLKDSGVDFIGEIPEHWEVKRLKYVVKNIGDVDHYMPPTIDNGIPYVMTGDLKNFASEINFNDCKKVSQRDYYNLTKKIKSEKGDVVLARYATIGTVLFIDIDKEFLVSYSCVTIKTVNSKILGIFLYYYFKTNIFEIDILSHVNTNTQGNVGISDLKKVNIILPPIQEQKEIVEYIDTKLNRIDKIIELQIRQIEKLKELKTTLIDNAVTGKIKVC